MITIRRYEKFGFDVDFGKSMRAMRVQTTNKDSNIEAPEDA